jgi:ACT domain-containing protein
MKYAIIVNGEDRIGIISEIASIISKNNINIYLVKQSSEKNIFKMTMYVEVEKEEDIVCLSEAFKIKENDLELRINIFKESEFGKIEFL